VERASPWQVDFRYAYGCTGDPFDAASHIESGTPSKRQQQDPLGINAVDHEVGNAMGQRLGFARPCTSNYQQRPRIKGRAIFYAVLNSAPLFLV
jgi:hypothetical protein